MKKPHLGILIKPSSYDCNMACDYCYYRGVERIYGDVQKPRMSLEVMDQVCAQYRDLDPMQIKLGWQGGEPMLMGLDFFRAVIDLETRHARRGDCWGNSLQTNGVLVTDQWCEFFARNHFLIGISVDGPPELNTMRKFPNGKPAYESAMRAIEMMKGHAVEYNVLVVISTANVEQPEAVFRFLVDNDIHFAQVIPCTEPAGGKVLSEHSITTDQYGEFMTRLFDAWVENDDESFYVRHIDNWLHLFFRLMPECCEYRQDCSNLITIEWNGDVYPCDFFVEQRYRMGNVLEQTLDQMLQERVWRSFVTQAERCPAACRGCEWLWACQGGCARHRMKLGLAPDEASYLCQANKRIFQHVFSRLEELKRDPIKPRLHGFLNDIDRRAAASAHGGAGTDRPDAPARSAADARSPGRNDPCPCGSGKKFKQCCMGRARVVR